MRFIVTGIGILAALLACAGATAQQFGGDKEAILRAARDNLLKELPSLLKLSRSDEPATRDPAAAKLTLLTTLLIPDTLHPSARQDEIDRAFRTIERIGAPALAPLGKFIDDAPRIAANARRLYGADADGPVARLELVREMAIASRKRIGADGPKRADPPAQPGKDGPAPKDDDKQPLPGNPYANVKVGDWVRYQHTDHVGNLVIRWEETRTVTRIDDKTATIERVSKHMAGEIEKETMSIDRATPLGIARLLDFGVDQKVAFKSLKEGRETLTVGQREVATTWTTYQLTTPGFQGGSAQKVWRSAALPLSGIVRTEMESAFSGSKTVTEAIDFGTAKADDAPKKPRPGEGDAPAGIRFVPVPAGEFDMGAIPLNAFMKRFNAVKGDLESTLDLLAESPPIRKAKIARGFEIGKYEVTIGQFRAFVADTGHVTDAEKDGRGGTGRLPGGQFGDDPRFIWKEYGFPVTDEHPVANVSWNDAVAFCAWLSKKEGRACRLPTEAEWEYACRGGSKTRFAHGDAPAGLVKFGNLADRSLLKPFPDLPWALPGDDGFAYSAPVGSFQANAFGLHDMHGNVLEWCADRFSAFDPVRDHVKLPAEKQILHVLRGGNWFNDPATAGCACRSGSPPAFRNSLTGFRVVRESHEKEDR